MFVTIPATPAPAPAAAEAAPAPAFLPFPAGAGALAFDRRPLSLISSRSRAETGFRTTFRPLAPAIAPYPSCCVITAAGSLTFEPPDSGDRMGEPRGGGLERAASVPLPLPLPLLAPVPGAGFLPRFRWRSRWISSMVRRSRFLVPSAMSPIVCVEFCSRKRAAARFGLMFISTAWAWASALLLNWCGPSALSLRAAATDESGSPPGAGDADTLCLSAFSLSSPSDSESDEEEEDDEPELDDDESSSSELELLCSASSSSLRVLSSSSLIASSR